MILGHEVVNNALIDAMNENSSVVVAGLGVNDPKGVFGTTLGLNKRFGASRVFEHPTAENSFTGIALGLAISGFRPVLTYQRVEFALLGFEQIVNQAAKWSYMTNGQANCPICFRMIVGRGWGQGPQHSQSLEAIFAHFPGLIVYAPGTLESLYYCLKKSALSSNPTVFIEHRWLHYAAMEKVTFERIQSSSQEISGTRLIRQGSDATLVAFGIGVMQAKNFAEEVEKLTKVQISIIEVNQLNPMDLIPIFNSVSDTKRLAVFDSGWVKHGIGEHIIAEVCMKFNYLVDLPILVGNKAVPIPSTRSLANYAYASTSELVEKMSVWFSWEEDTKSRLLNILEKNQDVPSSLFKGPF